MIRFVAKEKGDVNEPVLARIEREIGRQLVENGWSMVDLEVAEAEVVMSFLIESLFVTQEAVLREHPRVKICFVENEVVHFVAALEMIRPLHTKMRIIGFIVGQEDGRPKLEDETLKIKIENGLASMALSAFGLERIVRETLNDLPGTIKLSLPARLIKLGFDLKIANVQIYFQNEKITTKINL